MHGFFFLIFLKKVCGMKWSFDDRQLASGGNDNKVSTIDPFHSPFFF